MRAEGPPMSLCSQTSYRRFHWTTKEFNVMLKSLAGHFGSVRSGPPPDGIAMVQHG
jgi:hypothetical protein